MRSAMDQMLAQLHQELIIMGAMCEEAINNAVLALIEEDNERALEAIALDRKIDEKEREIEALALKIMLRHQPVAKDLRQVSSTLKMITDMERIGDQARDISEITPYVSLSGETELETLKKMAAATARMVTESVDAFVRSDLTLARKVIDDDDFVDTCFLQIRDQLVELIKTDGELAKSALDLLMITKYFERIGDHATNIAEWVVYSITGIHGDVS